MKNAIRFDLEQIEQAIEDMSGFCIACGHEVTNIEPDATGYLCDSCGCPAVHGAEELLIMGLVD